MTCWNPIPRDRVFGRSMAGSTTRSCSRMARRLVSVALHDSSRANGPLAIRRTQLRWSLSSQKTHTYAGACFLAEENSRTEYSLNRCRRSSSTLKMRRNSSNSGIRYGTLITVELFVAVVTSTECLSEGQRLKARTPSRPSIRGYLRKCVCLHHLLCH